MSHRRAIGSNQWQHRCSSDWSSDDEPQGLTYRANSAKSRTAMFRLHPTEASETSTINNEKNITTMSYLPVMIESQTDAEKGITQVESCEFDGRTPVITHPSTVSSESNDDDDDEINNIPKRTSGIGASRMPPPQPQPRFVRTQPEGAGPTADRNVQQLIQSAPRKELAENETKELEPQVLHILCCSESKSFALKAHNNAVLWFDEEVTTKALQDNFHQISKLQSLWKLVDEWRTDAIGRYKSECSSFRDQDGITPYQSYYEVKLKAELDLCKDLLLEKFVNKLEIDSTTLKESQQKLKSNDEVVQKLATENRVLKELLLGANKCQQQVT